MKKPILVTGSHRSGSTWIGTIISYAPGVRYAHEPFNVGLQKRHPHSPINFWFEYLSDNTPLDRQQEVLYYLKTFYGYPPAFMLQKAASVRSVHDMYLLLADLKGRVSDRTLIKDPIALMSAPWIQQHTGADVIVAIRHPAAFVASLLTRNWHFDFNNFLDQPLLMKEVLHDHTPAIEEMVRNRPDIIQQGICLWNVLYDTIRKYREMYGNNWIFVRHEDISLHPVETYQEIFYQLGLDFTAVVEKKVIASTSGQDVSGIIRNARKNTKTWQHRLSPEQISHIREGTHKVWKDFYSDRDWE